MQDDKLKDILDSLEDGYYETDLEGIIGYGNKALCNITEFQYDEIVGKKYTTVFSKEDNERIYELFHEVFKTGVPAKITNWNIISRTGKNKKIEASISLIRNAEKKITGFRGILRDITEKNRMENELLRTRKFEAIGILAGGIAHDYNNALTAILGNISLAKMEVDPANKSLMEILNDAEEASLKAVELTRRLGTYARGGKPERKVIDYADSLRMAVSLVLGSYTGTYELHMQENLWKVDIDEFQINQVITFILNNAVESMKDPGKISITAENFVVDTERSHHEISLQQGNYVRILISDEGTGIAPDDLSSIFDPYYTTKEMASGMGLATSYAIIKRHHGYIDVKSTPGEGSTFYLYLPIAHK